MIHNIMASFTSSKSCVTASRYRYDYGQRLVFKGIPLPSAYEVHFSNEESGQAKTVIGNEDGVLIPDEYFLTGETVYAWLFLHDEETDGRTMYKVKIPVINKAKPIEAQPTPVEQDVITQTIAALNHAVELSETNVTHYPKIEDGTWHVWDAEANGWSDTGIEAHGDKGDTGNGIESAVLNADYTLTLTFTDGTIYTTPSIRGERGEKGDTGNGIASIVLNADYTLTIRFTDGTSVTTSSVRGAKGNGISMISKTGTSGLVDTYTITFDDGETTTFTVTNGDKGDKGDTGATPNLTIGNVETLEPTESATATITGTAENPVLNLGLPQGRTGEVTYEDLESILPRDTATGNPITITDGQSVIPVKSLEVELEPIQDLNGYDKPWAGGAGANVLEPFGGDSNGITFTPQDDGTVKVSGTAQVDTWTWVANGRFDLPYNGISANDSVVLYSDTQILLRAYDDNGTLLQSVTSSNSSAKTTTIDANAKQITFYLYAKGAVPTVGEVIDTIAHFYVAKGSTFTSWTPYENICPIDGHTAVNTHRTGKNLLPNDSERYTLGNTYRYITRIMPDGVRAYMSFTDKDTSVNVSDISIGFIHEYSGGSPRLFRWCLNDGRITANNSNTATADTSILCEGIFIYPKTEDAFNRLFARYNIMVELGSTATDYEPYLGETYTTDLGQTVYGGTLDVVSGELVIDRAMVTLDGTESGWQWYGDFQQASINLPTTAKYVSTEATYSCNRLAPISNASRDSHIGNYAALVGSGASVAFSTANTSLADFKAWANSNNLQFCYELATPQTIQLTPQEIRLLVGDNNLWSDGQLTVVYSADVTKWIEKRVNA